jgi:hypothetical protein
LVKFASALVVSFVAGFILAPGPASSAKDIVELDRSGNRPQQEQEASRGAARMVYEYKVEEYPQSYPKAKGLQGWLNERGSQGWQVKSGSAYLSRFMFERSRPWRP